MLPLLILLACGDTPPAPSDAPPPATKRTVTVYSGRGESLVGPLFDKARKATGIDIQVQYGDTPEMVTRMLTEGAETPADLIFAQDSGHLGALAARKALKTLPAKHLAPIDPKFRDADGLWVGSSGRLRTMVVSTALPEAERPKRLADLADPKWKGKLGWAPGNGSFQAHVSALRALWGEDKTRTWLEGVKANEPKRYPKNSPQVAAAASGEIQIGWVNHYYWHRAKPETALNVMFEPGDAGNVMMLAGVGISTHTPHDKDALEVLDFLISEEAQAFYAKENFEYPTRTGMKADDSVPALGADVLATVKQQSLSDLGPTRTLLQSLGLL